MQIRQKTILFVLGLALLVFLGALAARRNTAPPAAAGEPATSAALMADHMSFDFGTVSMATGNVTHPYILKNTGDQPLVIKKMYTSCMCTTATFEKDGRKFGPFGMPGHSPIPSLNQTLAPGEELTVTAEFDPNAHGPAGVGRIDRVITIETDQGNADLQFTALVTP